MDINYKDKILDGFKTATIDANYRSNLAYRPQFVSNNYAMGRKVIVSLEQELSSCDEFIISVAFITKSGITPLLQILEDLEKKGIPGKILTTDYLTFSEPDALDTLASLKNIDLRMFKTTSETGGFHTKGYIFRQDAGRRYKEGIYSPITQNERHMLVYKNARSAEKGFFMRLGFEHWFDSNHKSLVVMANPKTVVNDRYAKKEVKNQVIRADQLISVLKNMKSDIKTSKKDMLDLGQSILSMNIEDRKDYIEKFRELKEEVDNSNQTTILDVDAINNNSKNDCTDDASIETTSYTDEPLKANDILPEFQDFNPNDMICPRCGHKLVLRTATKGSNKGNQFWGCSNFPKCRYIANVN